jgi:peptidoglycan/LPS O-acetylase OafA/YrhL
VVRSLVLQGALHALLLLAPAALARRAWRRWSWRGGLPALALAIGFWTMCFVGTGGTPGTIDGRVWHQLGNLLFPVPLGLPQIAFVVHVAGLIERGDRRRLGRFLAFALVLAFVAGGAWLLLDQQARQPGEYYTPHGALWILAVGTYLAGLGPLGRGLWHSGRRVARRLLRREPTSGPDRPGGTPTSGNSADSARA